MPSVSEASTHGINEVECLVSLKRLSARPTLHGSSQPKPSGVIPFPLDNHDASLIFRVMMPSVTPRSIRHKRRESFNCGVIGPDCPPFVQSRYITGLEMFNCGRRRPQLLAACAMATPIRRPGYTVSPEGIHKAPAKCSKDLVVAKDGTAGAP